MDPEDAFPILPHSSFGDPDCLGYLNAAVYGDQAIIVCTECEKVLKTVRAEELQRTLNEMELTLEVHTEICPACGTINLFAGDPSTVIYWCSGCGKAGGLGKS
jgi:hypothetical protein